MNSNAAALPPPTVITIQAAVLREIMIDMQRLESFQALVAANDCAGFLDMSDAQQRDLMEMSADMCLDIRCRLAALLP